MSIHFFKYQGAGNDFVLVDNRDHSFPADNYEGIKFICDRRFGIGGDGFMLLEPSQKADFKMVYYNADGRPGSMCGNGGRCITAFAHHLNIFEKKVRFEAGNHIYTAEIDGDSVHLQMSNVDRVEKFDDHYFLDTGSPHHIVFVDQVDKVDVVETGRAIRYGAPYFEEGSNVNFVEQTGPDSFKIRTYERGVEDETLSCGTGVTAVALAVHHSGRTDQQEVRIQAQGGKLKVSFDAINDHYEGIVLSGPATYVFEGQIELP